MKDFEKPTTLSDVPTTISNTTECRHRKVYATYVLSSYPAQVPWICSICGEEGVTGQTISETYDQVKVRFNKTDPTPV